MKVWSVHAPEFYDDENLMCHQHLMEDFLRQVEIYMDHQELGETTTLLNIVET